jgi:hypothetical protein
MSKLLFSLLLINYSFGIAQSTFPFTGYTASQTFTTNGYSYTNTQNGTTMTAKVTQSANPNWFNLTGPLGAAGTSPNNATYAPGTCGSFTGLFLATDRTSTAPVVTLETSFSPAVCGPVTFTIADLNGANASFRDDVTISAFDQNNVAIPLTTSMVTNNGTGNCNGGAYGASYTHLVGNSLKIVGCSFDDCALDYFNIYSSTKTISRITIAYASGNSDWNGTAITDPALQYIIISPIRAYTPVLTITPNCATNPITLTGALTSPFPPNANPWGVPSDYPSLPAGSQPTAPTYLWTGTAGTINSTTTLVTTVSGLTASGGTFTLTGQNNRGCVTSRSMLINSTVCASLPIELNSFKGAEKEKNNQLDWSTSSEFNNDFFILERSADGIQWQRVSQMNGSGTSNSILNYQYNDYDFTRNIINYYRLSQTDYDGTVKNAGEIVAIDNRINSKAIIRRTNILGQIVSEDQKGIVIYVYEDGTIERVYVN